MAKKRSCRRTDEERSIHEQAVTIRKMTDKQLIEYIEQIKATAFKEAFTYLRDKLLTELSAMRGIGDSMMSKISKALNAL